MVEVLFPRYIFIQADPTKSSISPVRNTRGVIDLVRFDGQPAVVTDEVIEALLQREVASSGLLQDDRPIFCLDETVRLMNGPLAGMESVFVQDDGEKRVIILLELLGKTNKIRINRDLVVKAA